MLSRKGLPWCSWLHFTRLHASALVVVLCVAVHSLDGAGRQPIAKALTTRINDCSACDLQGKPLERGFFEVSPERLAEMRG